MAEVIVERKRTEEFRRQQFALTVAELQTATLAGLLAGLAQSPKAAKGISNGARKVNFRKLLPDPDETEEEKLPSPQKVMSMFGPRGSGLVGVGG